MGIPTLAVRDGKGGYFKVCPHCHFRNQLGTGFCIRCKRIFIYADPEELEYEQSFARDLKTFQETMSAFGF